MREFVACSDHQDIRVFNVAEAQSVLRIKQAHSDNVRRVSFVGDHFVLSAGHDKLVKLWDLRNHKTAVASLGLAAPVEDFTMLGSTTHFCVANGNLLDVVALDEASQLRSLNSFVAF